MGSPCLFTRQQTLKIGYFYWLRVKSLNHLHTELNLGYLKGTKFCLESKASLIDISSIDSFKHGAILYNEAEVFSLSITNPNGRPMLPFDWLIHSSLILASWDSVFVPAFCG